MSGPVGEREPRHTRSGGDGDDSRADSPVTPPRTDPARPVVVTVAIVLWTVIGVLMVGMGALYLVALVTASGEGSGGAALVAASVLLVAAGVAVVVAARRLVAASRPARRVLTITGGVLAVAGLVQLTFLGVAGAWFVAFLAGAVLLHLPTAREWFAVGEAP